MKKDIEHALQCACVHWFRIQYPEYATLIFAVPNGGARNAITGARLKDEGVTAGVADLILLLPHREHGVDVRHQGGHRRHPCKPLSFAMGKTAGGSTPPPPT